LISSYAELESEGFADVLCARTQAVAKLQQQMRGQVVLNASVHAWPGMNDAQ
jgi:hypothetical protein